MLPQDQIDAGLKSNDVSIWNALGSAHNVTLFLFFAALVLGIIAFSALLKYKGMFDKAGQFLDKGTAGAVALIRIAFGLSLIVSATNHALYGPELPLSSFGLGSIIYLLLIVSGIGLIIGFGTRLFAAVALAIWLYAFVDKGPYLFTYANYLGEAIALILLPSTIWSVDTLINKSKGKEAPTYRYARFSFPVARILFAFSLLYTAITIKFMHTALTLDTVNDFHLTRYFPFDPLFVVLGAACIEVLVALLFLMGFMQRLTTVIFLLVMTLSLLYFKESVWPHYLLIALGVGMLLHKPDTLTIDARFHKNVSENTQKNKRR